MPNALNEHGSVRLKPARLGYGFSLRRRNGTGAFRVGSPNRKIALRPAFDEQVLVAHFLSLQVRAA
jgi:hypothetical protein